VMARGVRLGTAACALAAVLAAAPPATRAAEPAPAPHPVPEPPDVHPTIDEIRLHEAQRSDRAYAVGRIQWCYPQKLAGTIGVIVTRLPADYDCATTCLLRGMTFQANAGLAGGGLALGYGSLVGETGASRRFLRHPYVGWGARAAYLRTWRGSELDPGGASFLGGEAGVTIAQFSLVVGLFHPVGPDPSQGGWRVFGGAGWGF
jgi:hypothetical protein